jgi:hypothetical protein
MRMLTPIGFPTPPSVATLRHWSVLEVVDDDGNPARLVAGMLTETRMRLTSQVEQFEGGQVVTRSGSVYTLEGPPATHQQFDEQSTRREALLAGREAIDVTLEYV